MPDLASIPVLTVRGLGFAYAPHQAPLFTDWSSDLLPGITRIEGESGKTTLLRLLAGELRGRGELSLLGTRLHSDEAAYRQAVCWFDPREAAFDALTPEGLMQTLQPRYPALDTTAWQRHLRGLDLEQHLHKPLYMLSTGSRRKAGLAVALSAGCALTLLDEPTGGLDAPSLAYLEGALTEAARHPQRAIVLVCSRGLEAMPLAGTIRLD